MFTPAPYQGADRTVGAVKEVTEVVEYLRSRGLAPKQDHGRVLEILLELPARLTSRRVSVSRAATLLYTSRRSLGRLCRRAGMPSPSHVLTFGRALHTLGLIRARGCSVARAADETGWADSFSFSATVHRLTGLRPSMARTKGLIAFAEAWLQKELARGTLTLAKPEPPPCPSCGHILDPTGTSSFGD